MTPARRLDRDALQQRIRELGPWYQDIELAPGISTKHVEGGGQIFPGQDIPTPLWRIIERDLPPLAGLSVLDIGSNAGYMSFAAKRLGAARVLGIESEQGGGGALSFIRQAEFCREVLGLDVEFQRASLFDFTPERPFDVVLFCGVLYHLEDWTGGLDRVRELVVPGPGGTLVLETAVETVTQVCPGARDYRGDPSTYFVPSRRLLEQAVLERGFDVLLHRQVDHRSLMFLRVPA
jgi:tRNA (mo5U34)-methyltransferase